MLALPRVSSNARPGVQVPTAIPTDILSSPKTKPTPTETKPPGGGGNGNGNGNNNGGNDNENGGDDLGNKGDKDGKKDKGKDKRGNDKGDKLKGGKLGKKKGKRGHKNEVPEGSAHIGGSWTTDKLVAVAARLRSLGWSREDVEHKVFAPFILAGPAGWVDTWHAPRYGPAPGQIRQHEGQDVFCNYGEPVLATEDGTIQYDSGGLGGNIARLFRPDGTYWYFAHLSEFVSELSNGDRVETGDVIGYCGNSGDAIATSPHVHFGWYHAGGVDAMNPLRHLINWLHAAERNALSLVGETARRNIRHHEERTAQRMFGDAFAPDRSELRVAGESLWASGSAPSTGAFALAQTALQAALSEAASTPAASAAPEVDQSTGLLDPDSALARLLNSSSATTGETGE